MKLESTDKNYIDLNFEIPTKGVSICVFEEGIQKRTNEKSGKTTLQVPLLIEDVVEGDPENVGKKITLFVPIESDFGGRQLLAILNMTGLIDTFVEKLGREVDPMDDRFINPLKLRLVGKKIKVSHDVQKDSNGKDRTVITRLEGLNGPATLNTAKSRIKPKDVAADESW